MKTDGHWVIEGDPAQERLAALGYHVGSWRRRHGVQWLYMVKEIEEDAE